MFDAEQHKLHSNDPPGACFATEAELEMADRLRRQLEQRYLGDLAPPGPCPPQNDAGAGR